MPINTLVAYSLINKESNFKKLLIRMTRYFHSELTTTEQNKPVNVDRLMSDVFFCFQADSPLHRPAIVALQPVSHARRWQAKQT